MLYNKGYLILLRLLAESYSFLVKEKIFLLKMEMTAAFALFKDWL
jgi:hypothetical protein